MTLRRCFTTLRAILDSVVKIIAGGEQESRELKSLFITEEYKCWERSILLGNAMIILTNTNPSSEGHRLIKALLAESMGPGVAYEHGLGSRRSLSRGRIDFLSMKVNGSLEDRKKRPSGKSHVSDNAIINSIGIITKSCSTVAWSNRCHRIREGNKIKSTKMNSNKEVEEMSQKIYLPSLHREMSRSEMFEELLSEFPDSKNHLDRSAFFRVAGRLTRTQQKSLCALDYHLIDLLIEPHKRLQNIINDLYQDDNEEECNSLLKDVKDMYYVVQHKYPSLVDSSELPPHDLGYAIGKTNTPVTNGICKTSEQILCFFKNTIPSAIDGSIGSHYTVTYVITVLKKYFFIWVTLFDVRHNRIR